MTLLSGSLADHTPPASEGNATSGGGEEPADPLRSPDRLRNLIQSLADSLPLNLLIKDVQGRRVFANRGYCELHGYDPQSILGKTDSDLYPSSVAQRYGAEDARVLQTGEQFRDTEALQLPPSTPAEGPVRWVERVKTPIHDDVGAVVGIQVLFWDVTDRVQAEEELSLERDLLHCLMDHLPDAIYFKDRESRFLRLSRAMLEKFGLNSPAEAVGKTDADIFTREHATQALEDERRIIATGQPLVARIERETWPHRPDTWVSTTKMPLRSREGEIVGTFGISRDVTELQQAQEALRRARDAADSANRAKGDFLANVSHEIRTPLNGIIGMTELLLTTPHSEEQDEYLQATRNSADSLLSILNDVLDFSKIEEGKLDLERIALCLRDTLAATLRMLAGRAAQKGLELAVHIPPSVPDNLIGDPVRLRQVIVNLVGNAIKFTHAGEVVVKVEEMRPADAPSVPGKTETLADPAEEKFTELHFSVRDTGVGIPFEKQEAIFAAFVQADASTTREYGGTGLGLAIAAHLVRLMGGRIWVESSPGKGSTFHFTARLGRADPTTLIAPAALESLQQLSVLIVDDNKTNRIICRELVESWGMRPVTVESGPLALDELTARQQRGEPIHLVLLDVMMPHMDGFDVLESHQWRQLQVPPRVILLSSAGRSEDRQRAGELGIARCLVKPVTHSELFDAVAHALGDSSTRFRHFPTASDVPPSSIDAQCVLLAEDGLVNQQIAQRLLEKRGHSVTVVTNGAEAVNAVARRHYDIVLMDVQMPVMDGLLATKAIREAEQGSDRHVPIVAMTAHAMKGDRERCLAAGMDGYIAKPFRPDELFRAVEDPLGIESPSPPAAIGSLVATRPAYDLDTALVSVAGSRSMLADMAKIFVDQSATQLAEIVAAHHRGDLASVASAAHSLRGAAAVFGADPLCDAAWNLEQSAQQGDQATCEAIAQDLEQEVARLNTALSSLWQSPS
jgi:two-component system, sensor histidine kinase and response regulator